MTFTVPEIIAFIIGGFGLILTLLNIIDKQSSLKARASEPFDKLKARVDGHDVEISDIKLALKQGNDRFREQESTNEVLIHSTLALIEFEIQYCLTEHKEMSKGLEKAKEDLNNYLARNR